MYTYICITLTYYITFTYNNIIIHTKKEEKQGKSVSCCSCCLLFTGGSVLPDVRGDGWGRGSRSLHDGPGCSSGTSYSKGCPLSTYTKDTPLPMREGVGSLNWSRDDTNCLLQHFSLPVFLEKVLKKKKANFSFLRFYCKISHSTDSNTISW